MRLVGARVVALAGVTSIVWALAQNVSAQTLTLPPVAKPAAPGVTHPLPVKAEPSDQVRAEDSENAKKTGPEPHIALLLPLDSAGLASVASHLRDGWKVAADYEGKLAAPYQVYPLKDDDASLAPAAKAAIKAGAVIVVAGLTRDGARRLAHEGNWGVPILALNLPQDVTALPESFLYLSLAVDLEARDAAFAAFNDGLRSALVVTTQTPLSLRVADAFEREWSRVGGALTKRVSFNGSAASAAGLKAKTADLTPDLLFYALDAGEARVARPYLPNVRLAYGTSLMSDLRSDVVSNLDVAGTRFVEMPWFVQPDHPAVAVYARPKRGVGYEHEKLYALGIDAYRVAVNLLKPRAKREAVIDGVTGKLEVLGNAVQRQPLWVEYVDGKLSLR